MLDSDVFDSIDRTQRVNINSVLTYSNKSAFNVPQRSVLRPILYCLYSMSVILFIAPICQLIHMLTTLNFMLQLQKIASLILGT